MPEETSPDHLEPMPIEQQMAGAVEGAEQFVQEMRSLDAAWAAGRLHEWVAQKLDSLKKGAAYAGDDSSTNP